MEFKREVYQDLKNWQTKAKRKPLLLMGARQIGKTTLLKAFGTSEYKNFLYLNLERQLEVHDFFTGNKDPQTILDKLAILHRQKIQINTTLIVLDEIQECRDALISLKYFQEEMPDIHIIGAGSLLGLTIGNTRSFPVGKVEFLDMYPLSFSEYLAEADGAMHQAYHHFLKADGMESMPIAFFNPLNKVFKEYLLFGAMPEVASQYLENRHIAEAQQIQDQILRAYELDFVKHADKTTSTKIQRIWNSIPSQLGKENKKFIYKVIRQGARAREYEEAIQWLVESGLVNKIPRVSKAGLPLKAYEDVSTFKLYVFETGLLIRLANLEPSAFINGDQFFMEFKGSIAENYVSHSLKKIFSRPPYYWTSEGKAEIDYVIALGSDCIPIEVKSGTVTKAKSLAIFKKKYNAKVRVRISNLNLKLTDDLLNIPLFFAEHTDVFIEKAIDTFSE